MLRGAAGCATVSAGLLAASTSRRMSFIGSTDRTRGTTSKLFSGGGDCVNHSSVLPCHGSLPARHHRAEDRHARGNRQHPRPAALHAHAVRAAPEIEQPTEQQHRQA